MTATFPEGQCNRCESHDRPPIGDLASGFIRIGGVAGEMNDFTNAPSESFGRASK